MVDAFGQHASMIGTSQAKLTGADIGSLLLLFNYSRPLRVLVACCPVRVARLSEFKLLRHILRRLDMLTRGQSEEYIRVRWYL